MIKRLADSLIGLDSIQTAFIRVDWRPFAVNPKIGRGLPANLR
jgi:hypothetical protein